MGINDEMDGWRDAERQRARKRSGGRRSSYGDGLTADQIRLTGCLECGAVPGTDCDRSRDCYRRADRDRLQRERVCHWVRQLAAYGVPECKWDDYLVRHREGARRTAPPLTSHPAVELIGCARHQIPPGVPCPRPCWPYCSTRKAAVTRLAGSGRRKRPDSAAVPAPVPQIKPPGPSSGREPARLAAEDLSWLAEPARPGPGYKAPRPYYPAAGRRRRKVARLTHEQITAPDSSWQPSPSLEDVLEGASAGPPGVRRLGPLVAREPQPGEEYDAELVAWMREQGILFVSPTEWDVVRGRGYNKP